VTTPDDEGWILTNLPYPVVAALLIYKGSRDGWTMSKFHKLCDRMGPTLTVMKTKAGAICGGFTMKDWTSDNLWENDSSVFVFRVDTKVIYAHLNAGKMAIACDSDRGPYFGQHSFDIM